MKHIVLNEKQARDIMCGKKTTHRLHILSGQVSKSDYDLEWYLRTDGILRANQKSGSESHFIKLPIKPGEYIYVKEPWSYQRDKNGNDIYTGFEYKADEPGRTHDSGAIRLWKRAENMPTRAARTYLRVTVIGCQWLQDMTQEDARREGYKTVKDFASEWDANMSTVARNSYGWRRNPIVEILMFDIVKPEELQGLDKVHGRGLNLQWLTDDSEKN